MLEELHAVVAVEHHDGVLREAAVVELAQQAPDLVVELGHAAIVEIEDLVEVEFLARLALAADDLERLGQPGHGELGRAGIGRIGEPGVVGVLRCERRMRGRIEEVEQEGFVARSQTRQRASRAASEHAGLGHAAEVVNLGKKVTAETIVQEQRQEQADVLRALADEVLQVPLILGQIGDVEAEIELAQIGAAPVGNRRGAIASARRMFGRVLSSSRVSAPAT